jgi:lipoprotein-anchoring transpeptidase ErfK/SrfK
MKETNKENGLDLDSKIAAAMERVIAREKEAETANPQEASQNQMENTDKRDEQEQKKVEQERVEQEQEEIEQEQEKIEQEQKAVEQKEIDPVSREVDPAEGDGGKRRTLKKGIRILIALICLAIVCIYAGIASTYTDKFMPGTRINNIVCDQLTVQEAEVLIEEKVEDYSIKLSFREKKSQSIKGSDINYAYISDGSVEKIMKNQKVYLWLFGYMRKFNHEIGENIQYDEASLEAQYNQLANLQPEAQVAPQNAFVNFQNGQFEIVPEVQGTTIDSNVFLPAVKDAISKSNRGLSAEKVKNAYLKPEIYKDHPPLAVERDELNALGTPSITYKLPQGDEVLDGNTTRTWLVRDEQGHYIKDEAVFDERLIEYVATLADRTDTVGKERPFTMTGGRQITVAGGSYGWKINQNEEIAMLRQNVANGEQIEREPVYTTREVTTENNGFGSTYIELNLGAQHLYYYVDGKLAAETDFVSGRMTRARYTPPGIFTMYYKQQDRVLRGDQKPDGTYGYESYVKYWMPFNRGIGLHDASWRGSFGGSIYRYSGSHGCINMPRPIAEQIYGMITKDVPIICFYPDGYSLN